MKAVIETTMMPQFNLVLGWAWLLLGFLSGLVMGLFFHREDWLGGYGSFRRRLYRLAHISFFGLGIVNLAFYMTARETSLSDSTMSLAGLGFALGSLAMPLCCVLMAHCPAARPLFAIPVLSLLLGGSLTIAGLPHHYTRTSSETSLSLPAPAEKPISNEDFIQSPSLSTRLPSNHLTFHSP